MLTRLRARRDLRTALATLALLMLAGICSATRPTLTRKAPYLIYPGVNTEMDVHWQLYSTAECLIEWGTDDTYSLGRAMTSEYGFDHQHTQTLTGLLPGELHDYRVVAGADTHTGTFRAAPPDDVTGIKFLAYGDTRTYPAIHDSVAAAMIAAYTADPELMSLVVHMGDIVGNADYEPHWDTQFFDPAYPAIKEFLASVPYEAIMGNHERTGVGYRKYFPHPFVADRYWSFDYGPVHFTMLDQYVDYGPGSAELDWIESDLAASDKPWKIICLHEPGWASGGPHDNNLDVQDRIQPLCVQYGVSIVFSAHNHYYCHALVNGVHHVTTAGGGAPLYTPESDYPYVLTVVQDYHYCRVAIDGDSLALEAVDRDGVVIDSFTIEPSVGAGGLEPTGLRLAQNVPNPFNPRTEIEFSATEDAGVVTLAIHNLNGQVVRTLVDGALPVGPSVAVWDGRDDSGRRVATGVYFATLRAGGQSTFRKMVLIK